MDSDAGGSRTSHSLFGKWFGGKKENSSKEDEIKNIMDEDEEDSLDQTQKEMIDNVFEFDDRTVSEIMTHRTDCVVLNIEDTLQEVLEEVLETGYSRLPVYKEDIDDIVGVLYVKDLLVLLTKDEEARANFRISDYMRKPFFVPFSRKCSDLFADLTEQKIQMAIVVDEYGGTFGIVTMEDLLESIVGNMQDEFDNEEAEISQIGEDEYDLAGWVSMDELERLFDIEIPEDEYESDTIGGVIIEILGRIPAMGESPAVELEGLELKVLESNEKRIDKVRCRRIAQEPEEKTENPA
ncbi:MAG: HlyC/CorC family transporter [Firmicutes bacterium]|nr:HlyC/CorC family transporter [Bacillota bacterium]